MWVKQPLFCSPMFKLYFLIKGHKVVILFEIAAICFIKKTAVC